MMMIATKDTCLRLMLVIPKIDSDLPFLSEIIKIDKWKKLICTMYGKKSYVGHIKSLKLALDYGLILEKKCIG